MFLHFNNEEELIDHSMAPLIAILLGFFRVVLRDFAVNVLSFNILLQSTFRLFKPLK